MASIPIFRPRAPAALPNYAGAGLSALGSSLLEIGDLIVREEKKQEELATREVDTNFGTALRNTMYGEDGVSGFYALQSKAAIDEFPKLLPKLEKLKEQYLADNPKANRVEAEALFEARIQRFINMAAQRPNLSLIHI